MAEILVLQFKQIESLNAIALDAVTDILEVNKMTMHAISVEHLFSIMCAASMYMEIHDYDGIIVLGHVLDDTKQYNRLLYQEALRCFSELSVHYAMPVGFGLFLTDQDGDISDLCINKAQTAAFACVELIKLKDQLGVFDSESSARYSN